VNKAILVAQFLRERAWWPLDSAGASAPRLARSVVSLLDQAAHAKPGTPPISVPRQAPALETTPEPAARP
jgi:hypothetical protein